VWYGDVVNGLEFYSNLGMISQKFGTHTGKDKTIDATTKKICGVKGKSDKMVNQICFAISRT
jgi:hypothetical protein